LKIARLHGRNQFRLALCGHEAAEVAGVCLLLMVRGHLVDVTVAHLLIAAKTGVLAVVPALGVTFTRHARHFASRWTSAAFLGVCGFLADAIVHQSHYPGAYTEAALTGVGASAASILMSYTPFGKRIDRLADVFLHQPQASAQPHLVDAVEAPDGQSSAAPTFRPPSA
jgi:hypothetical protein